MLNRKNLLLVSFNIAIVGFGCSQFQANKAKLASFPSSMESTETNGEQSKKLESSDIAKLAVDQLLADIQLSQIDGIVGSPEFAALSGTKSGWGQAASSLLNEGSNSGGWGGNSASRKSSLFLGSKIEARQFAFTRDCDLGGTVSVSLKVKNINTLGVQAFAQDTTSEMGTETSEATVDFSDCRFNDGEYNEYSVNGKLNAPDLVHSVGTLTVKSGTFELAGEGGSAGSMQGQLRITLPDSVYNCSVSVEAEAEGTSAEVQSAQRKGNIEFSSVVTGDLCGVHYQTESQSTKVVF